MKKKKQNHTKDHAMTKGVGVDPNPFSNVHRTVLGLGDIGLMKYDSLEEARKVGVLGFDPLINVHQTVLGSGDIGLMKYDSLEEARKVGVLGFDPLINVHRTVLGSGDIGLMKYDSLEEARKVGALGFDPLKNVHQTVLGSGDIGLMKYDSLEEARKVGALGFDPLTNVHRSVLASGDTGLMKYDSLEEARKVGMLGFDPISDMHRAVIGTKGIEWKRYDPLEISMTGRPGLDSSHLSMTERAMQGIEGITWDHLNPIEKSIRGIDVTEVFKYSGYQNEENIWIAEARRNYHAANIDFTNRLSEISKDYSFTRIDSEDGDNSQLLLISNKPNGSAIPLDEVRNAIGVMPLIEKITTEDMVAFVGHLQRYPMLGLEHKIGKLIRHSVKSLARNVQLTGEFYRCRPRKSNEMMPWTEVEMWEAPSGISSQGRFNAEGNGFLYLSRAQDTAILEMKQPTGTILDIMKIDCESKPDIKVIDISNIELQLFRFCMFRTGDSKLKKEYLVSNFLSQCCQIENIHAIKYKSVYDSNTSNYVFFDYMKEWFKYQSTSSKVV